MQQPTLDDLHRRHTGPVPRGLLAAWRAGGAAAHARAEARGRAVTFARLAADTRRAICQARRTADPATPRLQLLVARLTAIRNAAVSWHALSS